MTTDWFVRCISNITRIKSGKWMKKKLYKKIEKQFYNNLVREGTDPSPTKKN